MKKLLPILILIIAALVAYQFLWKKDDKPKDEDTVQPITPDGVSGAFNQSYARMLQSYFKVKEALVASDTAQATVAANDLAVSVDSLKINDIQGDSTGIIKETARNFAGTIKGSALGLAGENTLNAKRKEFEMISDAIWSLTRTVRYSGQKVYWKYCPMAFNNKGAYWMSHERAIRNPYFGDEMLECGSVEDSLDYSAAVE